MNNADDTTALQAQIALTEQLQEMLLYMITHELRTPVMTIMGFTDILLSDSQNGTGLAQSQSHLERIRSAAQRQNAIIQGLQQIASLQRHPLDLTTTNLSEVVSAELVKVLPQQHRFQTRVSQVSSAQADANMTSVALHALLSILTMISQRASLPSIEFGEKDKTYYLRASSEGFDFGAEHTLPMLLRRLQSGIDFPGAGMNLLIAATIVHRHGGDLRFSTTINQTFTFEFKLP